MPFDSSDAVKVIRREDGLFEKDNFDMSTAVPVVEIKADVSEPEFKAQAVMEEERARAAVELEYKRTGQRVPLKNRIAWALTSESAQATVAAAEMTLFTHGIYPVVKTFQAIVERLAGPQELPVAERIKRNILFPEEGVSIVENLPDYEEMPTWAKILAQVSEEILLYGGVAVARGRIKQALYPKDLSRRVRMAEDAYVEETIGKIDKRAGIASPEEVSIMKRMEGARLQFRARLQQELATINAASGKTVIQNDFEKRSIWQMIMDDLFAGVANEAGAIKIGQVVTYQSATDGLMVGTIKQIVGNRVTIDMGGREIVAALSQVRVPELPPLETEIEQSLIEEAKKYESPKAFIKSATKAGMVEPEKEKQYLTNVWNIAHGIEPEIKPLESVIPTKEAKKIIREKTGQVKVEKVIKESQALKRLLKREEQITKEWQKDFDKAMIQELENERKLINQYEKDIGKLEQQIAKGEFKLEAEKIRARFRLEKMKAKQAEIKQVAAERELLRKEIAEHVEAIRQLPPENIAVEYKEMINTIKRKFDLRARTKKTMAQRESMKAYVARMQQAGLPIEIPEKKLAMLDKVTLKEMTMEHLRTVREEVERLTKLGQTKFKARQAVYEAQKEKIKKQLVQEASAVSTKEIPKVPIGDTPNKAAERMIKLRNYAQKTKVGLTPIEGLADVTGMQSVKKVIDKDFNEYLEFNDKDLKTWYEATKDFKQGNFDRIGVYAISQQEGGMQRLEFSGVSKQEVAKIKLTPEEQKAYELARKLFDKHYEAVKKYSQEVYNADVGKLKNYVSFMANNDAMNELEIYERFGKRPDERVYLTKTVEKGFTEKRSKEGYYKIEKNIDKILRRHLDDVAYMLTMGRDIKMYYEIINTPEMHEALGDLGTVAWLQYFDLLARKGGSEGAKRIALLDILRRNIGAGYLGLRLSSALVQFSSFGDTLATIGAEYSFKGALAIANDAEWRSFVIDNFPEVRKAIGDDIAFREFGEDLFGRMQKAGMTPLQTLDGLMRSTAAAAACQKLAAEQGIQINLKKPDKGLILEATKLMRQSQGSSFFKDQPLSITTNFGLAENKSLNKTILTFQSFMLNRWDNINRQIWRLGIKKKNYKKASMALLWLMTFGIAAEVGLRNLSRSIINIGRGEQEKKKRSFLQEIALNTVQVVPLLGQVVSAIVYSSNPVPVINAITDFFEGLGTLFRGKEVETKVKGGVRAAGALAAAGGITGAGQLSQIIQQRIKKKKRYNVKKKKYM